MILDIYTKKGSESSPIIIKRDKEGKKKEVEEFLPYLIAPEDLENEEIKFYDKNELIRVEKKEKIKAISKEGEKHFLKLYVKKQSHLKKLKEYIKLKYGLPCYEYDINTVHKLIIDKKLTPAPDVKKLNWVSLDIEVETLGEIPNPKENSILSAALFNGKEAKVITTANIKKEYVENVSTERELLKKIEETIIEWDCDILLGYNSGNFDIPYILERAKKLSLNLTLSPLKEKPTKVHRGLFSSYHLKGIVHIDLYPISWFFSTLGIINPPYLTLKEVFKELYEEKPEEINVKELKEIWLKNTEKVIEYNKSDAVITYKVAEALLPLLGEISKLSKRTLFESSLSTSGQFVEYRLMWFARQLGYLIPSKPSESERIERERKRFEGAYVKLPQPGVYENVAVVDFKSMYPSIILTYNVCPYTITKDEKEESYISPTGIRFRKQPKGFLPSVLEKLYKERSELKQKLKELEGEEKEKTKWKVQAYKILINSFYGYLGYSRSRWYCFECAESVAAWGREIIKQTESKAENFNLKVIYSDTDSLFLKYKQKKDVMNFLNYMNNSLPGVISLDLEGFYKRALFVTKKGEKEGAKKKYALLDENNKIKIKGFELVRRDWSEIAKEVQKHVLDILLKEGNKEKAINVVKKYIEMVKNHKLPIEKFVIYSKLNKDPENYEVISPELMAAKRWAQLKKIKPKAGMYIGYVITKQGKSISDKAYPLEMASEYDEEYYINHQILPAVMKIIKELGVDEKELKTGKKQTSIKSFFN